MIRKRNILQVKSQRKWKFFWNFPKYATPSGIITNACTVSNPGILEYKPPYKCFLNFILISFLWHSIISVDSIDGWSRLQRAVVWTSVCLAFAFTLKNEQYFWICFNEFSKNLRSFCLLLKTCFLISKVILWRDFDFQKKKNVSSSVDYAFKVSLLEVKEFKRYEGNIRNPERQTIDTGCPSKFWMENFQWKSQTKKNEGRYALLS